MRLNSKRVAIAAVAASALAGLAPGIAGADDPPQFREYYSIFERGQAKIPHIAPEHYVPQGLAYWPERDQMILSYYDDRGGKALLSFLDRATSKPVKSVYLDGKIHAGTLTMSKNYLWVSATSDAGRQVFRYAKSALDSAGNGATVTKDKAYTLKASSVMEIYGDKFYVGQFNSKTSDKMYRYAMTSAEEPAKTPEHSFTIPSKTQGVTITPNRFFYSRSAGRDKPSEIDAQPAGKPIDKKLVAPNMAEDMATVNGQLYIIYESGARKYGDASYKVRTVHHGKAFARGAAESNVIW
ncbi:hypothetical protein [Sciscionella marina]|uniref:hypothetical protein n=1 Tax=Sciscionella marina TaxID=508770 RepID=UPI00036BCF01|nr:hypothetical protein [Sciscionella marina]